MANHKERKIPDVLCPFLERECPYGEETALRCWRLRESEEEVSVSLDDFWLSCSIATRILLT
jgi:hypothetical protein